MSEVTISIEADKSANDRSVAPNAIEVKTQRVQEVELTPSEFGTEGATETQWERARSDSREEMVSV